MSDDLRATLESAIESAEAPAPAAAPVAAAPEPTPAAPESAPAAPVEGAAPEGSPEPAEGAAQPENAAAAPTPDDEAPRSWKASVRNTWSALPPEAKQEIMRREKTIERVLTETDTARKIAGAFQQAVRPYEARIRQVGVDPITAVNELMKADYVLSTAAPAQRAAFMAKLIADYGVDIRALDDALAGSPVGQPVDPVRATMEQLLNEKLSPLQQYIQRQQQAEQYAQMQQRQEAVTTVEQMAAQTDKFPFFNDVRATMADVMEVSSRRGVYLTLEQAYTRAVAVDPEVSAKVSAQSRVSQSLTAAQAANAQASKAKQASRSVSSSPAGAPSLATNSSNLRDALEAAMSSVGGGR